MTRSVSARRITIAGVVLTLGGIVLILTIDQPVFVGSQAADVGLGLASSVGFVVKYTVFGLGIVLLGTSPVARMIEQRFPLPPMGSQSDPYPIPDSPSAAAASCGGSSSNAPLRSATPCARHDM